MHLPLSPLLHCTGADEVRPVDGLQQAAWDFSVEKDGRPYGLVFPFAQAGGRTGGRQLCMCVNCVLASAARMCQLVHPTQVLARCERHAMLPTA